MSEKVLRYNVILDARACKSLQDLRLLANTEGPLMRFIGSILVTRSFKRNYIKEFKKQSVVDHGEILEINYHGFPIVDKV